MQSCSKATGIPHCREYCDGNVAEFYCPECAALFCSCCYEREHCGSERKAQHGKLTELRAICSEHKHTLDYFNLTLLQPMCIICKKESVLSPERANHVIEHIETIVPKLRSLMEKKLQDATESIGKIACQLTNVETSARSGMNASISHVQCCFAKLRQILDEREAQLMQDTKKYFDEFLESGEGIVQARNTLRNLRALSEEGKLLLNKDPRSLVVEFPAVFMRLKELCALTANECQMKSLKIAIYFGQDIVKQLRQAGVMSAQYSSLPNDIKLGNGQQENSNDANSQCSCSSIQDYHTVDVDTKRCMPDSPQKPCKEPTSKRAEEIDGTIDFIGECDKSPISRMSLKEGVSGVKRHSSDVSGSPLQETTPKKTRKIDTTSNFPEEHEKSPLSRTPVKAVTGTAGRTMQSLSPLKLSKLNELRVLLKRSPQHSSVASPNSKTYVASPRRKRGGALSKEFMKCDIILKEIWAHDESIPFVRPVDKKQSPDYYKVIKKPMDLSVVKEKLHSLQYTSVVDFLKDIRLMLKNCKTFNKPGSYVYDSGEELSKLFNLLVQENFPNFEEALLQNSEDGTE